MSPPTKNEQCPAQGSKQTKKQHQPTGHPANNPPEVSNCSINPQDSIELAAAAVEHVYGRGDDGPVGAGAGGVPVDGHRGQWNDVG